MQINDKQDTILKDYEAKSHEILRKMMMVLMRAQRKVDDKAYLATLQKLDRQRQK